VQAPGHADEDGVGGLVRMVQPFDAERELVAFATPEVGGLL
jgi:hypothetical protein